jgi:hypothetical protein
MHLKSVKLDNNTYHEYLAGGDVNCAAEKLSSKDITVGEHVMVFKDTVAADTDGAVPKREMQSEYIGIEGTVIRVPDDSGSIVIRKL